MFPSNLEYINDNVFANDNEDISEMCDCVYRQCRSSDTNTSDSEHCHFWLALGRDTDFCASVLILYLCRQNVCKEVEVWHLCCSLVQNNLYSFCSFTEGKIHWISSRLAPAWSCRTAGTPWKPGSSPWWKTWVGGSSCAMRAWRIWTNLTSGSSIWTLSFTKWVGQLSTDTACNHLQVLENTDLVCGDQRVGAAALVL